MVHLQCSCSLAKFTSWFHVHIDPEVDPEVSRYHLLQHPRSGWFEGHHQRDHQRDLERHPHESGPAYQHQSVPKQLQVARDALDHGTAELCPSRR